MVPGLSRQEELRKASPALRRSPEAWAMWNIEMSFLVGLRTKRNLPWPSIATRPPSRRSLKGEPGTELRAPVWPPLLKAETSEEGELGGEPGSERKTYCWFEVCAEAREVRATKMIRDERRRRKARRDKIREGRVNRANGKGPIRVAIGLSPAVSRAARTGS